MNTNTNLTPTISSIKKKDAIYYWYMQNYKKYLDLYNSNKEKEQHGLFVELGSGSGLLKEIIPQILCTDVFSHTGIDMVVDATKMPFANESVNTFFMTNVLHHIPDVERAFAEIERCLIPGGSCLIIDHYPQGVIAKWIFKYFHEPFDEKASNWSLPTNGLLSSANSALSWIVFFRDREIFIKKFPLLKINSISPHGPLLYWLAGGLKSWSLLPNGNLFAFLRRWIIYFDNFLISKWPNTGSFMDILLNKKDDF
ncbi:MAG: class I SAM-dependent methyltransferase [Oligoflexia bacterium]|nr:class I SAM-dependent methyltransferase [Oligoflexia bacterium]